MRVWFNKSFSGTYHLVGALKSAGVFVIASHTSESAMLIGADVARTEEKRLTGDAYVRWAIDFAREYKVDVFVPGKEAARMARARAVFLEHGVRLLVAAEPDTLSLLGDKARFYAGFDPASTGVLPFRLVTTLAGFRAAYAELTANGGRACIKPSSGVFGHGFRFLVPSQSYDKMLDGDLTSLAIDEAERLLGSAPEPFRPLLVMRYAEGSERSIDCIGHEGELVQAVVRRKQSGTSTQVLEDNPRAIEIARKVTRAYGLRGIYNVQIKDAGGAPHILEINPRASGGIHVAMASGLNFPLWAARLAMGACQPSDVPVPRTGMRVSQISQALVIGG